MELFPKRAALMVMLVFLALLGCQAAASGDLSSSSLQARKLLNISSETRGAAAAAGAGKTNWAARPERMGPNECSQEDVVVYQSSANPLPSGIPTYTVQIINVCGGCAVSDVHVSCGDFASTQLVDPGKFQRLGLNDCIVKGGARMEPSEAVSFQYSNSFAYPLNVASVACE
ncbi:hypothetical protein ACP4OV_000485 [Aristida adscensionis]